MTYCWSKGADVSSRVSVRTTHGTPSPHSLVAAWLPASIAAFVVADVIAALTSETAAEAPHRGNAPLIAAQ